MVTNTNKTIRSIYYFRVSQDCVQDLVSGLGKMLHSHPTLYTLNENLKNILEFSQSDPVLIFLLRN